MNSALKAERRSVHRRTDWRMDLFSHKHSKHRCNLVKFQLILVYLARYTSLLIFLHEAQRTVHLPSYVSVSEKKDQSVKNVYQFFVPEQTFHVRLSAKLSLKGFLLMSPFLILEIGLCELKHNTSIKL